MAFNPLKILIKYKNLLSIIRNDLYKNEKQYSNKQIYLGNNKKTVNRIGNKADKIHKRNTD